MGATLNPANEGYDPLQQIAKQIAKPNVLLVLDVSQSMSWDQFGHDLNIYDPTDNYTIIWHGVDSQGTDPQMSWTSSHDVCYVEPTPTPTPTPTPRRR